jgi:hypothetical protein
VIGHACGDLTLDVTLMTLPEAAVRVIVVENVASTHLEEHP